MSSSANAGRKRKLNHGGASARRGDDGEEGSDDEDDENSEEEEDVPPERMTAPVPAGAAAVKKTAAKEAIPGKERGISQDPIWGAAASSADTQGEDVQMQMDLDTTTIPSITAPDDRSGIRPDRYVTFFSLNDILSLSATKNSDDVCLCFIFKHPCRDHKLVNGGILTRLRFSHLGFNCSVLELRVFGRRASKTTNKFSWPTLCKLSTKALTTTPCSVRQKLQ